MDQQSAIALRSLGIALTSVLLIGASAVLLLASLCFGLIASGTKEPQLWYVSMGALGAGVALIIGGLAIISKLSRGIVQLSAAGVVPNAVIAGTQAAPGTAAATRATSFVIDSAHFSLASKNAVRNLLLAIGTLIAFDVASGFIPAVYPHAFRLQGLAMSYSILAYRLLAIAPYVVLLFAIRRSPSPRSFAYALAVPAIPTAWGVLSMPLAVRAFPRFPADCTLKVLAFIAPFALDIAILYFAWIAIKRTGIYPPPRRLIIACCVIFVYRIAFASIAGLLILTGSRLFPG